MCGVDPVCAGCTCTAATPWCVHCFFMYLERKSRREAR